MNIKFLSLAVAAALTLNLSYAQEANEQSKQLESIDDQKISQTVNDAQKPKKENMQKLLNDAEKELKQKAKKNGIKATVYKQTASIDVGTDDPQYYDYLTSAYNQAILELKAQVALSKAGSVAVKEAYSYYNKTVPDTILQDELKKESDERLTQMQAEQDMDGVFGIVFGIISKAVQDKPEAEKKRLEVEVTKDIFNKAYSDGFVKSGFDSIEGLVPYANFIVTKDNGEIEIGVLAYTTEKSIQLARDLKQGRQSKKTENKEQCKDPTEVADALSDEELLSTFGLKYFYNENCRPSLLAYGMDSFIKEEGMNADYRKESSERARGMADKFMSNFLNSNVNAFIKDTKVQQKTVQAMMKAARENDVTNYNAPEKKKTNAIIKEMSQEFSSSSSMNLRGIEDVRSWSVDKDDYEVVGVIRYYSRDSIEAANEKFNPKTQTNEKKSNKKAAPGVKKSNNLSVDDF